MTALDWTVIAAGTSAIAWINWYFFADHAGAGATVVAVQSAVPVSAAPGDPVGPAPTAAASAPAVAQATITVKGGYSPASVRVQAGQPVRLIFDRQETSSCSEEVVFADFGIRRFLPAHEQTVIEVTPPTAGVYAFSCGMGMLRGKLVAE